MGEQHFEGAEPVEPRSKVKLTRNAKGDPQWEVSVVEGADETEIQRLRMIAVDAWRALERDLAGSAA